MDEYVLINAYYNHSHFMANYLQSVFRLCKVLHICYPGSQPVIPELHLKLRESRLSKDIK